MRVEEESDFSKTERKREEESVLRVKREKKSGLREIITLTLYSSPFCFS